MKVTYRTANGRLTFEFESDTDKKLVANLAHIQEVFEEPACGCCKSERIRFDVREFEHLHYKLVCDQCGATVDLGQNKTGDSLFLRRFDKDTKEALPNRGWYVYAEKAKPAPSANQTTHKPESPAPAMPSSNGNGRRTPQTTADQVNKAIDAMNHATTLQNFGEWVKWAKAIPGTDERQRAALEKARQANKVRLDRASVPA